MSGTFKFFFEICVSLYRIKILHFQKKSRLHMRHSVFPTIQTYFCSILISHFSIWCRMFGQAIMQYRPIFDFEHCVRIFFQNMLPKKNQQHKEKMYLPIFRNCHFPMSPIGGVQKCIKFSQELYKANTPPLSKKNITNL